MYMCMSRTISFSLFQYFSMYSCFLPCFFSAYFYDFVFLSLNVSYLYTYSHISEFILWHVSSCLHRYIHFHIFLFICLSDVFWVSLCVLFHVFNFFFPVCVISFSLLTFLLLPCVGFLVVALSVFMPLTMYLFVRRSEHRYNYLPVSPRTWICLFL